MKRDTDFVPDWKKYPKLAVMFENRPLDPGTYAAELCELLREARADAVKFIEDVKVEELKKAREDTRLELRTFIQADAVVYDDLAESSSGSMGAINKAKAIVLRQWADVYLGKNKKEST